MAPGSPAMATRSRVAEAYELSLVVLNNRLPSLISCLIFLAESRVFLDGQHLSDLVAGQENIPHPSCKRKKKKAHVTLRQSAGDARFTCA